MNKKTSIIILVILILVALTITGFVFLSDEEAEQVSIEDEEGEEIIDEDYGDRHVEGFQVLYQWGGGDLFEVEERGSEVALIYNDLEFKLPYNWYAREENERFNFRNRAENCRISTSKGELQEEIIEAIEHLDHDFSEENGVKMASRDIQGNESLLIEETNEEITVEIPINEKSMIFSLYHFEEGYCREVFDNFLNI